MNVPDDPVAVGRLQKEITFYERRFIKAVRDNLKLMRIFIKAKGKAVTLLFDVY